MSPTPAADEPSPGPYQPYRTDPLVVAHDGPVTVVNHQPAERRNAVDSVCADRLREAFVASTTTTISRWRSSPGPPDVLRRRRPESGRRGDRRPIPDNGRGRWGPPGSRCTSPSSPPSRGMPWPEALSWRSGATFGSRRTMPSSGVLPAVRRAPVRPRHGPPPAHHRSRAAMDLILTGRAVPATEALAMGLVTRVVAPGTALSSAVALAHELAALPQVCLRSDRMSALEQWGLSEEEAAVGEARRGVTSSAAGDARRSTPICGRCRPSWCCARLTTPPTGRRRPTAPPSPPSISTAP